MAPQSLHKRGGGKKAGHVSLDQRILEGRDCLTHHHFRDLEQHCPQETFHEDPLAFLGEGSSPRCSEEALDLGSSLLFLVNSSSPLRWLVNHTALPSTGRGVAPSQVRIHLTDDLKETRCDFTFLIKKMYLFIGLGCAGSWLLRGFFFSCGERGLFSGCCVQRSQCGGFSCCGARGRGCAGFSSGSTWAPRLQLPGSRAQSHGLSCSEACGIFPNQGSNPCLLHWQAAS